MPEMKQIDQVAVADVEYLMRLVDKINIQLDNIPTHVISDVTVLKSVLETGEQMQQVVDRLRR